MPFKTYQAQSVRIVVTAASCRGFAAATLASRRSFATAGAGFAAA
jgi:hypothetical protein